jgi:biotin carboxylase
MIDGKKVLLVLGGIAQVCDIVKNARNKGIYVIVTDYLEDSPANKIADESYNVSITDVEGLVKLCKEKYVDGIMNYCIDSGQNPYQEVCDRLGFPCYGTKEQFDIMTNKDKFKEVCISNDIDVVSGFEIDNKSLPEYLDKIEFPVIIKPSDSRASKGLSLCNNKEEIMQTIQTASYYGKEGRII